MSSVFYDVLLDIFANPEWKHYKSYLITGDITKIFTDVLSIFADPERGEFISESTNLRWNILFTTFSSQSHYFPGGSGYFHALWPIQDPTKI